MRIQIRHLVVWLGLLMHFPLAWNGVKLAYVLLIILLGKSIGLNKFFLRAISIGALMVGIVLYGQLISNDLGFLFLTKIFSCLIVLFFSYIFVKHFDEFLRGVSISGALALIFFGLVFMFSRDSFLALNYTDKFGFRFSGFFPNPNITAALYVTSYLSSLSTFNNNRRKGIFAFLNLFGLILTQSRGALIAALVGTFLLFDYRWFQQYLRKRIVFVLVIVSLLTFTGVRYLTIFDLGLSRFNDESSVGLIDNLFSIEGERGFLFVNAIKTISANPMGIGLYNHHLVIGNISGTYLIPHNFILTELLNYGVFLGTFWLLCIAYILLRGLLGFLKDKRSSKGVSFVIVIAFLLFSLAHSLTDWFYLYIFFAVILGKESYVFSSR